MKGIGINEPCSEIFSAMPKTEIGAYCDRCKFEVIDFTQMSSAQIREVLRKRNQQKTCGHISERQLETLNEEFSTWKQFRRKSAVLMSFLLVFGMALFSCSSADDRRAVIKWRESVLEWVSKSRTNCDVRPYNDSILTGEIGVINEDQIKTIQQYPTVDGGIGMDPEFRDYLREE